MFPRRIASQEKSGRQTGNGARRIGSSRVLRLEQLEDRQLLAGDPVLEWNWVALEAVKDDAGAVVKDQAGPTRTSRALAIVHAAIFDAVNSIDRSNTPYLFKGKAPRDTDMGAAVASAAYNTLVSLYPHQKAEFNAAFQESLDAIPDGWAETNGVVIGRFVAKLILAERKHDGSEKDVTYKPGTKPGDHQPDPLHPNQGFLTPGWGKVKPFSLVTGSQFRSPPPPSLQSKEYAAAFNEVKAVGAIDAESMDRNGDGHFDRTPEQTEIGIFWAYDGAAGVGTPPRLYNQIVRTIAEKRHNSVVENARLFALANIAMADAGIASWETKYWYDFWRPVVAIRNDPTGAGPGGLDGNRRTVGDANWKPLGAPASNGEPGDDFTPPFPAYTSGHATFGAALFQTLASFYGTDNIAFKFQSDELNGKTKDSNGVVREKVTRHFKSLSEAMMENAWSRIYLGVHWSFDAEEGIRQGHAVADHVFAHELRPLRGPNTSTVADLEFDS